MKVVDMLFVVPNINVNVKVLAVPRIDRRHGAPPEVVDMPLSVLSIDANTTRMCVHHLMLSALIRPTNVVDVLRMLPSSDVQMATYGR